MTRYELFDLLEEKTKITKTGDFSYNRFMMSGGLESTHHSYGAGFYDVSIRYYEDCKGRHSCRVWFGTLDDGDYGSWKTMDSAEEAKELVEKVASRFEEMSLILPTEEELNVIFRDLGVYFCKE